LILRAPISQERDRVKAMIAAFAAQ
jgi:hypothetical protein